MHFLKILIMKRTQYFSLLIILLLFFSYCSPKDEELKIIFIGHCYQWHKPYTVDYRIEQIDFSRYDEIWLGGDLCSEIIKENNTLEYLDTIFNIKSPNTYWTLGNHDTRKDAHNWIEKYTEKKSFYARYNNGITRLVLNTCYNNKQVDVLNNSCENMELQYNLIKTVTDTITNSSHLIVLIHGVTWDNLEEKKMKKAKLRYKSNFRYDNYLFKCDSNYTFKNKIYPLFVKVRERGVNVVFVSGDYGQKAKTFEYLTKDSIYFIGSGINNSILSKPKGIFKYSYITNYDPDHILIFNYKTKTKKLSWEFVNLNEYLYEQKRLQKIEDEKNK